MGNLDWGLGLAAALGFERMLACLGRGGQSWRAWAVSNKSEMDPPTRACQKSQGRTMRYSSHKPRNPESQPGQRASSAQRRDTDLASVASQRNYSNCPRPSSACVMRAADGWPNRSSLKRSIGTSTRLSIRSTNLDVSLASLGRLLHRGWRYAEHIHRIASGGCGSTSSSWVFPFPRVRSHMVWCSQVRQAPPS